MKIEFDFKAAVEFLERWRPGGPWVLTAISVDQKKISTATFRERAQVLAWLETHENRNHYFHVNPCRRDLDKKAEKTDVASMDWLHVDLDPRPGETDLEAERERALNLLQNPPGDLPKPHVCLFSGGGYQGFWRLEEPIILDGNLDNVQDAERYNRQIELLLGGDACHNADRIMRLPGTVNRPTKKKREKGRVEALAEVMWFDDEALPIERFTPASKLQTGDDGMPGAKKVRISGNVRPLDGIEDLDQHVAEGRVLKDWVKALIVQGNKPDDEDPYPSRSEALFSACCQMVRAGIPDEVIYSVITDPNFDISESVRDKGSAVERYALRQIERAKEDAVDPWLRRLNDRYAVIKNWGGKCRIAQEVEDATLRRQRLSKISAEDFKLSYLNHRIQVGTKGPQESPIPIYAPVGKWWLEHPERRQYETILFAPGREPKDAYNLWRGFAYDPIPGDCSLYLEHLLTNVCAGEEEHFEYLVRWMARAVQHPDTPGYVAVVLRGKQGTGKSFFASQFGALWGRHFLHVSNSSHLVGQFNSHLQDCVVLLADEAFWAGDKQHESVLKTLITEETLMVTEKFVDATVAANYVHLIMASDQQWVVPSGPLERRFFVLDVGDQRRDDRPYFKAIEDQMKAGGYAALLHHLQSMDLSGFDVRDVPKTLGLVAQKELSLDPETEWWFAKLQDGRLDPAHGAWLGEVLGEEMVAEYASYCRRSGSRRSNQTRLGHLLKRVLPSPVRKVQRREVAEVQLLDGRVKKLERPVYYVFPSLEECREHWDREFFPHEWQDLPEEESRL